MFETFRYLIQLIVECFNSALSFMAILFIMMIGFSMSQFFRALLDDDMVNSEFWVDVHDILFNAFGDFAHSEKSETGLDWFLFVLATFIICLIMMNLFIGILGEKLSEILENREKNDYCELCSIVFLLENLTAWFTKKSESDERAIIIYADSIFKQSENAWSGRVSATTKPILKETKKMQKTMEDEREKHKR